MTDLLNVGFTVLSKESVCIATDVSKYRAWERNPPIQLLTREVVEVERTRGARKYLQQVRRANEASASNLIWIWKVRP